jgi:hypothetical protein
MMFIVIIRDPRIKDHRGDSLPLGVLGDPDDEAPFEMDVLTDCGYGRGLVSELPEQWQVWTGLVEVVSVQGGGEYGPLDFGRDMGHLTIDLVPGKSYQKEHKPLVQGHLAKLGLTSVSS